MKNKVAIDIRTEDSTFSIHHETDKPVRVSVQEILPGSDLDEAIEEAIEALAPVEGRGQLVVVLIPDK